MEEKFVLPNIQKVLSTNPTVYGTPPVSNGNILLTKELNFQTLNEIALVAQAMSDYKKQQRNQTLLWRIAGLAVGLMLGGLSDKVDFTDGLDSSEVTTIITGGGTGLLAGNILSDVNELGCKEDIKQMNLEWTSCDNEESLLFHLQNHGQPIFRTIVLSRKSENNNGLSISFGTQFNDQYIATLKKFDKTLKSFINFSVINSFKLSNVGFDINRFKEIIPLGQLRLDDGRYAPVDIWNAEDYRKSIVVIRYPRTHSFIY